MKKYKEQTVYRIVNPENEGRQTLAATVYICRGEAITDMKELHSQAYSVKEERLLYSGDMPAEHSILWRAYEPSEGRATSWYADENEAWEAASRLNFKEGVHLLSALFETTQPEPLPKEFVVFFQLDHKGRPYTRIDVDADRNGRGKGKIFFPDRSFVGADVGCAFVSISKEFDTYGFLSGKMAPYEMPDMKKFLRWAKERRIPNNTQVYFVNHPSRGKYLAVDGKNGRPIQVRPISSPLEFWMPDHEQFAVEKDVSRYTERKCTLAQLYLEDAWGK